MPTKQTEWWSLEIAAERLGYHPEGLRRRLRQLRKLGYVIDLGQAPAAYRVSKPNSQSKVTLLWASSKTVLVRNDLPMKLFNSKRGRRWHA